MEAWQTQPVEVAPKERDRQRRAAAQTPRPMGGFDRVPGQISAHPTPAQFPVPTPTPLLLQIAAQPTPQPGVQLFEPRWRLGKTNVCVPSVEILPQLAHDTPQRHAACPGRQHDSQLFGTFT
jgi:hypothetical protein